MGGYGDVRITGGAGFPAAHVPSDTAQAASGRRTGSTRIDTGISIGISIGASIGASCVAGRSAGTGRSGGRRSGRGPLQASVGGGAVGAGGRSFGAS